jgi:DNA-binding CsgD family transcriptional regulator
MRQTLTDFVTGLQAAYDADEVWRATLAFFADRGAPWLHYAYTPPFWRLGDPGIFRRTNVPQAWLSHYAERRYNLHDPAIPRAARATATFAIGVGIDDGAWSPKARQIYAESAEWGAGCTLTTPFRGVLGSPFGAMTWITAMRAPEFSTWARAEQPELHLASLAADARLIGLAQGEGERLPELSPRERECLLLLATGLRTDRIADRLKISNAAVDLYLANARRKLKAPTRDQALLKAVMLGKLTPDPIKSRGAPLGRT